MNSLLLNHLLSFGFNSVVLTGLSLWVYRSRPNSELHLAFAGNQLAIAWWSFFTMFMITSSTRDWGLFWDRLCLSGVVFIPSTLFHYLISFANEEKRMKAGKLINYAISMVFLILLWLTPLFIADVRPKFGMNYFTVPGPLYVFFVGCFVLNVVFGLITLNGYIQKTHNLLIKKQATLLFWFSVIGYGSGTCNYLLVYDIHLPGVAETSNYGVLILSLSLAYIIFKYKFLDIEVIIKKTLVFAGVVASSVSVIALLLALIQIVIGKAIGIPDPFVLMSFGIATAVLIYRPIERVLLDLTDKYLFQKKVSYRKLLKEATEHLAHLKSLKKQSRRIVTFLVCKARIANVSLYAYQSFAPAALLLQASYPKSKINEPQTIALSHPLASFLDARRSPLELYSIQEKRSAEKEPEKLEEIDAILELFKEHRAEAIIPCFGSEAVELARRTKLHLRGILFLGHQKSDEAYTAEDLDVFYTLAQESAIAIENARLYDEAVSRSLELARMNEDLHAVNKRLKETQAALMEEKKRALLAGISSAVGHEIRSPLSSQSTNLYFCEKRLSEIKQVYDVAAPRLEKPQQEALSKSVLSLEDYLQRVVKSADRIKGIVNTLVNLVKQRTEDKTEVQLKLLIASALEEVRFQTYWETLSEPKFDIQIPPDLPFILGITHDLQGVFVNLIINALHAMENKSDKRIAIRASLSDGPAKMIEIYFSDNGCGIPAGNLEKVFEHGFTTKGARGTGIGLFYCKDIIERIHGGSLQLSSEPGAGTTFIIRLPAYDKNVVRQG